MRFCKEGSGGETRGSIYWVVWKGSGSVLGLLFQKWCICFRVIYSVHRCGGKSLGLSSRSKGKFAARDAPDAAEVEVEADAEPLTDDPVLTCTRCSPTKVSFPVSDPLASMF